MKGAVLYKLGESPVYGDFPAPVPQNEGQVVINVKAASVKNLDKGRASGKHYASYTELPVLVGIDGVGTLEDGTRVYAQGISGMIAEQAVIEKDRYVILPAGVSDETAAALPNAVMGAALAIRFRAGMNAGDVVLINGATGVTGRIAVQIAKYYGAKKIIVTGRNEDSLNKLSAFGADEIISLKKSDADIIAQIKKIHEVTPVNIVIDYLWGHPAELIITALQGGGMTGAYNRVRTVTVGEMAGSTISLASGALRSSAIEICGSGIGSLSRDAMKIYRTEILPEMFQLAADGKLVIETEAMLLKDVQQAWTREMPAGKRLVIVM